MAGGVMVALVREAKGWTQKQLADAADVSQGHLSKVENGLVDLTGDRLERVAEALGCPVGLLISEPVGGLGVTCLHHRRRQSTMNAGAVKRVEAMAHLTRLTVDRLLAGIDVVVERSLPAIGFADALQPAAAAQSLRAHWNLSGDPIPNLIELLEGAGVVIVVRAIGTSSQDAVSMRPVEAAEAPLMIVNDGFSADRQRFTVAHELGHLLLHEYPADSQEQEANQFAAELLTPAAELRPALEGLQTRDFRRLLELKVRWGVSIGMLVQRAKDLGCISDRQFKEFRIRLSRMGWNLSEPGGVERETPVLLRRAIQARLDGTGEGVEQIAARALMTPAAFVRHYYPTVDESRTKLKVVI
ncbi:helix-turn-helix domain-containing protein [Kribbella sp. NPDC050241]|uniref:helix-turn-helix domain-containing protein n=1 Tax=Kribbella sp. NPDC050241 TaxID=3364115 RepID=UPI0037B510D5